MRRPHRQQPHNHRCGPTPEEIRDAEAFAAPMRDEIARLGWTIAGVAADRGRPAWMHTVGLLSRYDHPELIVVDGPELASEALLAILAMRVAGGETFDHESVVEIEGRRHELGWVHPRHFQLDTFELWEPLMDMHLHHFRPSALQVFVPDGNGVVGGRHRPLTRPVPIR
jgi:hypothetical protein